MADLERTSLGKSIALFRSSFLQPLLKSCKVRSHLLKYSILPIIFSHNLLFLSPNYVRISIIWVKDNNITNVFDFSISNTLTFFGASQHSHTSFQSPFPVQIFYSIFASILNLHSHKCAKIIEEQGETDFVPWLFES